jgi:hypothetical protein
MECKQKCNWAQVGLRAGAVLALAAITQIPVWIYYLYFGNPFQVPLGQVWGKVFSYSWSILPAGLAAIRLLSLAAMLWIGSRMVARQRFDRRNVSGWGALAGLTFFLLALQMGEILSVVWSFGIRSPQLIIWALLQKGALPLLIGLACLGFRRRAKRAAELQEEHDWTI